MDLRQQLAGRMKAAGLTQHGLAKLSGVPRQTIWRFLSGRNPMQSDNLDKLMAALDRLEAASTPRTP